MEIRDQMQKIAVEFPAYGYRRITAELQQRGLAVNHKRVLRMMHEDNLLCVWRRSFVVTTDSRHNLPTYPNLAREIKPVAINQLWVADITYIRLRTEFVYLAVVLDAYSRRVISWALGRTLEADLPITALRMALIERQPTPGLVHHSDRGVQYASKDYTEMLKQHQATISMSRKANPWDKAYASYCTSCEPRTTFSGKRRRLASLTPWAFRGGSGPGSSYSQSSRSFTG
jgi:transposase InsO family protein